MREEWEWVIYFAKKSGHVTKFAGLKVPFKVYLHMSTDSECKNFWMGNAGDRDCTLKVDFQSATLV